MRPCPIPDRSIRIVRIPDEDCQDRNESYGGVAGSEGSAEGLEFLMWPRTPLTGPSASLLTPPPNRRSVLAIGARCLIVVVRSANQRRIFLWQLKYLPDPQEYVDQEALVRGANHDYLKPHEFSDLSMHLRNLTNSATQVLPFKISIPLPM